MLTANAGYTTIEVCGNQVIGGIQRCFKLVTFSFVGSPIISEGCETTGTRGLPMKVKTKNTTIRKIEVQRLAVVSSKPFDEVVATLKRAVGHPIWRNSRGKRRRQGTSKN